MCIRDRRGEVPAALLLGLERPEAGLDTEAHHADHTHPDHDSHDHDHDHHGHDHDHHHAHDHHDHTHVAMQSAVVQFDGVIDRPRLEALLQEQIQAQGLLRLKGRAWLAGKSHPLQIQAVGPRLECWFDPAAPAGQRRETPGLEVVALGLAVDAAALRTQLAQALQNQPSAPVAAAAS